MLAGLFASGPAEARRTAGGAMEGHAVTRRHHGTKGPTSEQVLGLFCNRLVDLAKIQVSQFNSCA